MGFHPNSVNAMVRAHAAGHLLQHFDDVAVLCVVNHLRPAGLGHANAFGNAIDRKHSACSQHKGAADGELAHWAASPDRNHVASTDSAVLGGHVAGGKDV